jgi:hypothetical protein
MDWKPRICWQVPLFFELPTTRPRGITVRGCRSVDWGGEGILDWWCAEYLDGFRADQPVYATMEAELRHLCGAAVYDELAAYCEGRQNGGSTSLTLLPMIP